MGKIAHPMELFEMNESVNPLNWFRVAQDWFSKTERHSGFRVYLIFFILLSFFVWVLKDVEIIKWFAGLAWGVTIFVFLLLYIIKAFQDPDFCRSEQHIERMKKLDLEMFGSDKKQITAEVIDAETPREPPRQLESGEDK